MQALKSAANGGVGLISSVPSGDIVSRSISVPRKREEIPQSNLIKAGTEEAGRRERRLQEARAALLPWVISRLLVPL